MDTPTESTSTSLPEVEAPKEEIAQENTDDKESSKTEEHTNEAQQESNTKTEQESTKNEDETVTDDKNQEDTAENEDDDDEKPKRKKDKKRKKEKKDKKEKKAKKHKKRKHKEGEEEEEDAGEEGKDNESDDVEFKLEDAEDDDKPKKRLRKAKQDEPEENNQEGVLDDLDEDPEYESRKEKKKKKKKKDKERKKRQSNADDGTENNENIVMHDAEDEDAPRQEEEPPQEEDEIDQLLKQIKGGRGSRRKKIDAEELAMKEQTKVTEFVAKMEMVAEEDRRANQAGQPALAKVKALGELNEQLQKKHLQTLFIESNILSAMSKWLEPLPDGSLPNMKVRQTIFSLLNQFGNLDKDDLRESGIGKSVMLLYKHAKETADNKKLCKILIERWSRPIFGLNDRYQEYYRELNEQEQSMNPQEKERRRPTSLNRSTSNEAADLDSALDKKRTSGTLGAKDSVTFHAHIPEKMAMDFKIRPKSEDVSKAKKKGMSEKQRKLAAAKSPKGHSRVVPRAMGVSIEGRGFVPHV